MGYRDVVVFRNRSGSGVELCDNTGNNILQSSIQLTSALLACTPDGTVLVTIYIKYGAQYKSASKKISLGGDKYVSK